MTETLDPIPESADGRLTRYTASRLVGGTFLNHLGLVVPAALNLLLLPWIIRLAGPGTYGFWVAILAIGTALSSFDLGLASAVTREIAEARSAEQIQSSRPFVNTAFLLVTLQAVVVATNVAIGTLAAARPLHFEGSAALPSVALLAAIAVFAQHISGFAGWALSGASRFGLASSITAILSIARVVGTIAVLYRGYGLVGLAACYAVTGAAGALISVVAASHVSGYAIFAIRFDWQTLKSRVPFSLGSQGYHLLYALTTDTAPVIIIGLLLGTSAIVTYHLGQRIAATAFQIFAAAGSVLFTMACEASGSRDEMMKVVRLGTRWMFVLALPVSTVLFVISPVLLKAWIGSTAPQTLWVLRISLVGFMATAIVEGALYAVWVSSIIRVVRAYLFLTIPSIAASWFFVNTLGAPGAALGMTLTSSVAAAIFFIVASRQYRFTLFPVLSDAISGLLFPVVLAGFSAAIVTMIRTRNAWVSAILAGGTGTLVFLCLFFIFGVRDREREFLQTSVRRALTGVATFAESIRGLRNR